MKNDTLTAQKYQLNASERTFPPFSLTNLLTTCFGNGSGERVCVLIDLPTPSDIQEFQFLGDPTLSIQNYGYEVFYKGFKSGVLESMNWKGGEIFAYKETGGSNLDMEDVCYNPAGEQLSLDKDIYTQYDIILVVSTFSATAPLTAKCKEFGFRGATLHGLNQIILDTGLSVDYDYVSEDAEKLRRGLTCADRFEIDFEVEGSSYTLSLHTNGQEAQKSHGLCPPGKPDVANLPAGEVYFVPDDADGVFPFKYDESTIGLLHVKDGKIFKSQFVYGDYAEIEAHNARLADDPMIGAIGELGFGTQVLPFSGRDIQDEKILGTIHVATGRDDHLGGNITPDLFKEHINASHDDVLYAPHKTPEIRLQQARMFKQGKSTVLIENYKPAAFMVECLESELSTDA
jgi:aminopeptidase